MSLYSEYRRRYGGLIDCLEHARSCGRLAHAFLIHSPDARVRREFAAVVMQIVGCKNVRDGRPDTTCHFCSQVENRLYADCHTISPVGKMYLIKVGDRINPEPNTLRDMLDHLGYTSGTHRKFGVIEDADRMGVEAQNALLKTLEEPPPETTIILESANPGALLPTTRSRCQLLELPDNRFHFAFNGFDTVRQALYDLCFHCGCDLVKVEMAAARLISVSDALAEQAAAEAETEFAAGMTAAAQSEDAAFIKRMETRRNDAASGAYMRERREFITAITTFCSQIFLLAQGVSPADLPNPEMFEHLAIPATIPPERAGRILKEAEDLEYTLRFNVNSDLALRTFAVNVAMN
ncbi:MAG: hypothetical protein MR051_04495 [Lentisphaeria bacterium]|nr:hypothetical protein [Lentisphaeria bacterium]